MALKFSTNLRNKLLGLQALPACVVSEQITSSNLAYADNGGSDDTITDDGNNFITEGFAPGMKIYAYGSTTPGNDIVGVTLTGVTAGILTMATGSLAGTEAFAATTFIVACAGGSIKDVFHDGVLRIYSGTQPSDADQAVAGTMLLEITVSAGAFVAGAFDNGLEFGDSALGAISKAVAETWQDTGIASGTAGWFRLCANPTDAGGSSTSLPRVDGSIGSSGADLNMSSTSIVVGSTYTIDTFTLTMPEYYGA